MSGADVYSYSGHVFSFCNALVFHQERDSGENEQPGFFMLFRLNLQALEETRCLTIKKMLAV